MKIAHISDLHLNTYYRDSHLKEIRLILKYCSDAGIDHLFITGDLTDNASDVNLNILKNLLHILDMRKVINFLLLLVTTISLAEYKKLKKFFISG